MKPAMASKFLSIAALLAAPLLANARPTAAPNAASSNPAASNPASGNHMAGEYMESRTADVYTGPCIANSEANLTGQEAILAWHVDRGAFEGVSSGFGLGGVGALFCNRSFGAFLSFFFFVFFFEVSPFNPSGAAWLCWDAFSSTVAATGVAACFSFVFFTFVAFLVAASVFARAL